MATTETSCLPTVDDIFAEMIERRTAVAPISSLRSHRQRPGASQKRVRFAIDIPAPTLALNSESVAATSRRRLQRLERRFYTPFGQLLHGEQNRRLWRMKPGLYKLVLFDRLSGEATLRESDSSELMRVHLPRRMEWPWKSTHLKINKPGEDAWYPRGKAEWVRR